MKGWQQLDAVTDVMLVPGGMVIRTRDGDVNGNGIAVSVAMVFVPRSNGEIYHAEDQFISWVRANMRSEAK